MRTGMKWNQLEGSSVVISDKQEGEVVMRRSIAVARLAASFLTLLASPVAADVTRTLTIEIPPEAGRFAVENLAGTMKVSPGSTDKVVAIATVHAESEELAGAVRFEKVDGAPGVSTWRVRYPKGHSSFRYSGAKEGGSTVSSLLSWLGSSNASSTYDGRRVKVSSSSGVLVYADLEVRVPRRAVEGAFRNQIGRLDGANLEGDLQFDTGSGPVRLDHMKGRIAADTGSGDIKANRIEGSFSCDAGSGTCQLTEFRGSNVSCDVGSGDILLESISASRVSLDSGSGDIQARGVDAEEFSADTGSGDVELVATGSRLSRIDADTGSGDVTLRLGPDASFEAVADQGSGDIVNRFADAEPILEDKDVIGYRRSSGRTRIAVDTGSGDLILEPGS